MSAALTERNSHVHPTLQGIVNSLAPAVAPLRAFTVRIGQRGAPRLEFPCMARTSFDAVQQHDGLRDVGERIEVESADEQELLAIDRAFAAARYSGSIQQRQDHRALLLQIAAQDRVGRPA